jgi:hypothetical protein
MTDIKLADGTPERPAGEGVLTPEALRFLGELGERFSSRVAQLLRARELRQERLDAGELPDFLPETRSVREGDWRVGPIPSDLQDRRVEITGPTDRKMVINALNSGARVFMADCEDSLAPSWDNVIAGQANLRDAVRRQIDFTSAEGKAYRLADKTAVLIVRPRRSTCCRAASRCPVPCSTSDSIFSTTTRSSRPGVPDRTSTCRNSRAIERRGSGPRCSISPNVVLGSPTAPSSAPC